jgi:hypothetical protein
MTEKLKALSISEDKIDEDLMWVAKKDAAQNCPLTTATGRKRY